LSIRLECVSPVRQARRPLAATTPILLEPSDDDLLRAVEHNLQDLFRAVATLPGSEIVETPELSWHHAFPVNPMFKSVWGTRLDAAAVEAAIDERIAWFRERDAPFFFWWTGPSTEPSNLGERLVARGMIGQQEQARLYAPGVEVEAAGTPAMAADLAAMNEDALEQAPAGFAIDEVRDERALEDFRRVFVESYEVPELIAQAWVDATTTLGLGRTPWRLYVGRLDGEAVATNLVFNGGGVAGVYGIGVVPAARGHGIGGAITLAPLLDARDEGYRHAVLFSSAMGVRTYERIGFRLLDGWIDRFLWRAG
jgi:GNAT superfamily N-acetyltransferase